MEMLGKELPLYRLDSEPDPNERIIAYGNINDEPCHLSFIRESNDHLLVATVNGERVAVSGKQLLGAAASLLKNTGNKP